MDARSDYIECSREDVEDLSVAFDFVEPKYDGMWVRVEIKDNEIRGYSRTGNIKFQRTAEKVVGHATLVGEYLVGTQWSKNSAGHGKVVLFDCLRFDGVSIEDSPLSERRSYLRQFDGFNGLVVGDQWPAAKGSEVWDTLVENGNYEGIVFKADVAHPDTAFKVKRRCERDYICMGFEVETANGSLRAKNVIGGLMAPNGYPVEIVRVGCGLTNDQRREFGWRQEKYIGQVFTAKGNGLFESGAVRHPVFMTWREDKTADECRIDVEDEGNNTSNG